MIFIVVIPSASSGQALSPSLRSRINSAKELQQRNENRDSSLRSVQNDKMAFSYAFLEWMGHSSSAIPDMYFTMNDRYVQAVMNTAERLKIGQF